MPSLLQELVAHSTPDNTPCTYKGPPIGYCLWAWHPNPNGTIFSYSNIKTVRPAFAQMCQEEHCWYCETDRFKLPVMPPTPRPHHVQPVPIADPVAPPPDSGSSVTPTTYTLTSSAPITPAAASSPAASSSSAGTDSSISSGSSFASTTVEPPTTRATTPVHTPVRTCNLEYFRLIYGQ
ncbi:unnamed protein product [Zymoseptoria tritici ST99CH_1A5]|uniref:Uncharacterized protein n=1 Tax=Zymoseptoria tritici ST99CH_1A5 TaxID=1276529 RepID=A0A1Y6L715_ZYMTR|nr:unnamed protein product [Zymoseptoria tritici ST99CH_1A5]